VKIEWIESDQIAQGSIILQAKRNKNVHFGQMWGISFGSIMGLGSTQTLSEIKIRNIS
jgi:hypothetical protein